MAATGTRTRTRSTKPNPAPIEPQPEVTQPEAPTQPAWEPLEGAVRPPTDPPVYESVHVLQARILAELPPIGKDQFNEQQKFHFRGIDDAINALNPLLSRYGVRIIPHRIKDVTYTIRTSGAGKPVYTTNCRVIFRWYGPNGDWIKAEGLGEGTDSLDKSVPKAVQGAFKYMIFQTLAISTKEAMAVEVDRGPTPETIHPTLAALVARHNELPKDIAADLVEFMATKNDPPSPVNIMALPEGWWPHYDKWLATAEKKAADRARAAQDADATAPQDLPSTNPPGPPAQPAADDAGGVASEPAASEPTPDDDTNAGGDTNTEPEPEAAAGGRTKLADLTDEYLNGEAEVTWDQVEKMGKPELNRRLEFEGAMPGGRNDRAEDLRLMYWQAIGGEVEGGITVKQHPRYGCTVEGCTEFTFGSREERDAHVATHDAPPVDASSPPDDSESSDAAPAAPAAAPKPIEPEMLKVVQEMVSSLDGGAARAYAKYRREKGLPANLAALTFDQGVELAGALEAFTAA